MNADATQDRGDFDGLFSTGRFLLALGVLILISYPGLILGTQAFSYRDTGLFSYPVAYYLRDSLRHGQWPLWNPYSDCGTPFLAQWNTLALYPPSVFYILLPMPWALNCFLLGHLLLGGLGMYRLGRYWFGTRFAASVAGVVFAWNGLSIHCLMWPCHTAGLAWMPWVVWQCERAFKDGGRRIYWAALVGACQMLTGSPETILLTWLVVSASFLYTTLQTRHGIWGRGRRLLGIVALVSALSAAQLFPWLDLLAHGDRTSATGSGLWSFPPWGLANFLVPLFHVSGSLSGVFMQAEQQWTSSYYIGVVPLTLAVVALWRVRRGRTFLLAGLALLGVLLACGDAGFVMGFLKRLIPLLGFIRFPVKFIILTLFCLALLAGAGASWLQEQTVEVVRKNLGWTGAWIALGILMVLAAAFWFPFPSDAWPAVWPNALGRLTFLLVGMALLGLLLKTEGLRGRSLFAAGFLIWMGLDVCTHEPQQNPAVPVKAYAAAPPPMAQVPRLGESRAMLSPEAQRTMDHLVNSDLLGLYFGQRAELAGNCNLLNDIPLVGGFMSLHLPAEHNVALLLESGRAGPGLTEFLGVSQIASPKHLFMWDAQSNYMPTATFGQQPRFLDDDATLQALCDKDFSPRRFVYLPPEARGQIQAVGDGKARILSSNVGPSECVLETSSEARTMLVVAQAFYHCWQASVDEAPVPLCRANVAFQALEVPEGRHRVRLVYVDHLFWAGEATSACALLFCAAMIWHHQRNLKFRLSP